MQVTYILFSLVLLCTGFNTMASTIPGSPSRWLSRRFGSEKLYDDTCKLACNATSIGIDTVRAGAEGFVEHLPFTMPFSMVVNLGKHSSMKNWIVSSFKDGVDLARVGGVYKGSHKLLSRVRQVDDKGNRWFASGMAAAYMNVKNGRAAIAKGFVQGVGFSYVLDKVGGALMQSVEQAEQKQSKEEVEAK